MNQEMFAYQQKLKENISTLIENGKLLEAKELLCHYEKVEKDDIEIYSIKSVIAMLEGDMDEAERVLKQGLLFDDNHFDLNYNFGYFYQSQGEAQAAIRYYKKALSNGENKEDIADITKILETLIEKEDGTEDASEKSSDCSKVIQIEDNVIIVNIDNMEAPSVGNDLYSSRKNVYDNLLDGDAKTATIVIQGHNRLEKTKYCVECVLNYTKDIDYELILIDNGSSDGTFEYFKTVDYEAKKVLRITKDIGTDFPFFKLVLSQFKSKYLVFVQNDVYVTSNWLSNLLRCMESDNKIGWVMPMSSNIGNHQDPGLIFNSLDEMQLKAKAFNASDPSKWEKRLKLVNVVAIYKKEIIDMVGNFDVGFSHDFGEDDYCIRLRRLGYKLILCADTFVHFDHDFTNFEGKDPSVYKQSLEIGRNNFKEKYYGLYVWGDISNYEKCLINLLPKPKKSNEKIQILGIDVRCGTPILEIENYLYKNNLKISMSSAFTTQAKYYLDLKTICEGTVNCDRIEFLNEHFNNVSFDYIVIGEPINKYMQPLKVLDTVLKLAKKGSKVLFKLFNSNDIKKIMEIFGNEETIKQEMYVPISLGEIIEFLKSKKVTDIKITNEMHNIDNESRVKLMRTIESITSTSNNNELLGKILTKEFLMCIEKN